MFKKAIVFTLSIILSLSDISAQNFSENVNWVEWDEGYKKAIETNKVLFVYIHTSNCPWCRKMEKETLNKKEISDRLNTDFICVDFNPEIEKTYHAGTREFTNIELLAYITQNNNNLQNAPLGYPAMVFMLVNYNDKFFEYGYQKDELFSYILDSALDIKKKKDKKAKKNK
jgi:uncharacterized protein YyaL (SSP411 family)